jgi:hypothetical protein
VARDRSLSLASPALAFLPTTARVASLELPARPEPEEIAGRTAPQLASRAAGQWSLRWDPWTETAGFGMRGLAARSGPEISRLRALAVAEEFLQRHASLLGARPRDLALVRCEQLGRAWYVTWQQRLHERDVSAAG